MIQYLLNSKKLLFTVALVLVTGDAKFLLLSAQGSSPSRILVCGSSDSTCNQPGARLDMVWTFDGTKGSIDSPADQAGAQLIIEKMSSESIVIRRIDAGGATSGRTAVYTGALHGDRINGSVEWTWSGHPGYPSRGVFSAAFQDQLHASSNSDAVSTKTETRNGLPPELLVCENGGPCNAAWRFNGSTGTGTWFSQKPTRATLTVLRLEPDYILIRRTDTTDGITANYAGSLQGDHYSGTIVWSSPGNPGQSTGRWTATIPQTGCPTQAGLEADEAMRIGQYALMFKRNRDALACYIVAAKAGDATAQAAVGLLYYQGQEAVSQNYAEAFFWLHKAADQGVYAAERTVAEMYTAGLGTKRDPTMAAIYAARADEQKHDMERRQDIQEERAQRQADRTNRLLSSFVMGASFGLFF